MHGACNVKPPCVYCGWDMAKAQEKDNVEAPFNLDTLADYGPFFENAASLVNCSIGEPFMMKDFDALLDRFADRNKAVEISTNGQILTDWNIGRLVGRRIELYVSLDAATAATYAKLRNDTFDRILGNLRRLIEAKGGRGGLPRVHLVFMPMQVNRHELDQFVDLCADLDADSFVLRPLNEIGDELDWTRAGHRFIYSRERLDFDTLVRLSACAAALCRRRGVPFSNQLDFGGEMAPIFRQAFDEAVRQDGEPPVAAVETGGDPGLRGGAAGPEPAPPRESDAETAAGEDDGSLGEGRVPACPEPWKSLYVLRRGVLPCCYGARPLAAMGEYRETWNAPILQDIRRHIARGEFHEYCLGSQSCPIVRKSRYARRQYEAAPGPRLRPSMLFGHWTASCRAGGRSALKGLDQALFGGAGIALYRRLRRVSKT